LHFYKALKKSFVELLIVIWTVLWDVLFLVCVIWYVIWNRDAQILV